MNIITTYKALIKREFWEHRGAFIKAPIIISIVGLVITIGAYITGLVLTSKTGSEDLMDTGISHLSKLTTEQLNMFWDVQIMGGSTMYLIVLFFVVFFFMLGSLFDDRKDGSILFWKSLPISDANTVLSKLLTAIVFVPLAFIAVYLLALIANMVLYTVILLFHGQNPIQLVWAPASIFGAAKMMLVGAITQVFWALPIYGWLIFSSSVSKRRPFLFSIFVPAIVAFSWYWVNILSFKFSDFSMFKQPLSHFLHAMLPYSSGAVISTNFNFDPSNGSSGIIENMLSSIGSIEILYGAIFCAIMVALAIWLRRYRNTT